MVGHGRDEPDGAGRVGEGPVTRGARSKGTAVLHGLEYAEARGGSFGGDALAKLGGGDHIARVPQVRVERAAGSSRSGSAVRVEPVAAARSSADAL